MKDADRVAKLVKLFKAANSALINDEEPDDVVGRVLEHLAPKKEKKGD